MRLFLTVLVLIFSSSCADKPGSTPGTEPFSNVPADIEEFLSTDSTVVEAQVIARLKKEQVPHSLIKTLLRDRYQNRAGPPGLHNDLEFDLNGKEYPYALYMPPDAQPGHSYPLIVILHGMGTTGEQTITTWIERLSEEFIILCPSYPMGAWWSLTAERLVLGLIREVRATWPVDPNRVFLAGLSNGAIGAYLIGMFYPDHFAGIVPIAGTITERYMHFLVNLNNTPIRLIQGTYDPIFPIQHSRRIYKILTDMRYPVAYREHPKSGPVHGGHFLPPSELPPLVAWLKKQTRERVPNVVRMTREANHLGRIHWARITRGIEMAALQIPGPEKEPLNIKDGHVATLFASYKGENRFRILGRNLLDFEIYLSEDMVDFSKAIHVTTQQIQEIDDQMVPGDPIVGFNQPVEKNLKTLLRGYKEWGDPDLLFDAVIQVSMGKSSEFAMNP